VSLHDLVSSKIYTDIRVQDLRGNSIRVPRLTVDHLVTMAAKQGKEDVLDATTFADSNPVLVRNYEPVAKYAIEAMGAMMLTKAGEEVPNPRDLFGEQDTPIGQWQSQAEACFCAMVGIKERAYQSEFSWLSSVSLGHKSDKEAKLNWQAVCRCVLFVSIRHASCTNLSMVVQYHSSQSFHQKASAHTSGHQLLPWYVSIHFLD
jgi:hypothetical protein